MNRWWRAYDGAVDHPKLLLLTDRQFRAWFNLCCICSQNGGVLPPLSHLSLKLRVRPDKAQIVVNELAGLRLVDIAENGIATMHDWADRQFQSDVSTARVKRYRKREREKKAKRDETVSSTVTETADETVASCSMKRNRSVSVLLPSTSTTLESKEDSEEQASGRKQRKRGEKTPLPADFRPEFNVADRLGWSQSKRNIELERFCTSAKAHDRRYVNWQMAFDQWCLSPYQKQETSDGLDRESGKQAFKRAVLELKEYGQAPTDGESGGEAIRLLPAAGIRE